MASRKNMKMCLLNNLQKNKIYSFDDINNIVDLAGIYTTNDYNGTKSTNGLTTNGEVSLSFLISEMIKTKDLKRVGKNQYIIL